MNASEAAKLTHRGIEDSVNTVLSAVYDAIEERAHLGYSHVYIEDILKPYGDAVTKEVTTRLVLQNFKLITGGHFISISWEHNENN